MFFITLKKTNYLGDEQFNMSKKKGFIGEFKEFITRGSVIDLAVGVIIGGAFQKIVTSLVEDILMPLIGVLFGGFSVADYGWQINAGTVLAYGNFIQNIINFVLIGLFVFLMIKTINAMHAKADAKKAAEEAAKKAEEEAQKAAEPQKPTTDELLAEIRDLLKAQAEKEAK